ncbi:hypothetical protein TWF481_002265 [Arthrobotrys musiformis]|uniref:t-SNARE coiled-coil homology domain-containing protein n=1 Tax=Arthrobotrys musiformis TaxID=47236 RepID=A0AAV9VYS4_9PEZI
MPPIQHTFGTTGNAPSHPGAGATSMPQSHPQNNDPYLPQPPIPPPIPGTYETEVSIPSVPPAPHAQNAHPTNAFRYAHPYEDFERPQEPIPAYTRHAPNDSPDLLAARREYLDIEAQIQNETTELNHRLNNPSEDPTTINSLQDSIRKLYFRKGALMQRIQDLQDPNSYAFQQSQAMTVAVDPTAQAMLMYDDEARQDRNRALTLANYTVSRRDRVKGCICMIILLVVLGIVIIGLVVKKRHG